MLRERDTICMLVWLMEGGITGLIEREKVPNRTQLNGLHQEALFDGAI